MHLAYSYFVFQNGRLAMPRERYDLKGTLFLFLPESLSFNKRRVKGRKMKKIMITAALSILAAVAHAAVSVTEVKAQQRYPWNGMVDIDYTVVSDDANADVWVYVTGQNKDMNTSLAPRTLSGDGVNAPVKAGTHRMTWNVTADYPNFSCEKFSVTMTALKAGAPYMVVDLEGGVDAENYPVSYLSAVPEGGWTEEYKTSKLVLRLIPPGTFMMGSPTDELGHNWQSSYNGETLHQVTLTKPFYIGVFEVTQKQWELVMGTTPSGYKGVSRPVECVSYDMIRGTLNGAMWPAHNQVDETSFMGKLRAKVDALFDLPTEAQWEYACRAGTSSALNSGRNITDTQTCTNVAEVARYGSNQNDGKGGYTSGHTMVGSYLPNAWGLYDMHGNVAEWCLDWWTKDLGSSAKTDPTGATSGSYRLVRGGCCHSADRAGYAVCCRSAYRSYHYYYYSDGAYPSRSYNYWGFRLVCLPAE